MPGDERTGSSVGTIARRDFGQEARGSGRGRQSRRNLVRAEQRPSEYIEQDPAHIPRKGVAKDGGWALPTPRHSHPAHGSEVGTELPRGRLHRFLLKTYRELTTPKYRTHVFFFMSSERLPKLTMRWSQMFPAPGAPGLASPALEWGAEWWALSCCPAPVGPLVCPPPPARLPPSSSMSLRDLP